MAGLDRQAHGGIALDAMDGGVGILDLQGRVSWADERLAATLELLDGEDEGEQSGAVRPDGLGLLGVTPDALDRVFADGLPVLVNRPVELPDTSAVLRFRLTPLRDLDGLPMGVLVHAEALPGPTSSAAASVVGEVRFEALAALSQHLRQHGVAAAVRAFGARLCAGTAVDVVAYLGVSDGIVVPQAVVGAELVGPMPLKDVPGAIEAVSLGQAAHELDLSEHTDPDSPGPTVPAGLSTLRAVVTCPVVEGDVVAGLLLLGRSEPMWVAGLTELAETAARFIAGPARTDGQPLSSIPHSTPGVTGSPSDRSALERAIQGGRIAIHVQAGRRLNVHAPTWAEVLVRFPHPPLDDIPVATLIGWAERSGSIDRLCDHVMQMTAALDQRLRQTELPLDLLSINISAAQLSDLELPDRLAAAVRDAGGTPHSFALELTETAHVADIMTACTVFHRIRELGFKIMIDDFGTGSNTLQRLAELPFDALKIDGSLLRGAHQNLRRRTVLDASIRLAKDLDKLVIVEGVETAQDAHLVADLGADIAQGYFFSRPQPPEVGVLELTDWGVWTPHMAARQIDVA